MKKFFNKIYFALITLTVTLLGFGRASAVQDKYGPVSVVDDPGSMQVLYGVAPTPAPFEQDFGTILKSYLAPTLIILASIVVIFLGVKALRKKKK